ncbi:MAG: hypothetical protein H7Z14_03565 [Anaerolineae bacterium]|nr:hypothetical protein [Phycisphaerae bacterium]
MPEEMRPLSKKDAPDPSHSYERAHPEREGGMDQKFTPDATPDKMEESVKHRQDPSRQINTDEVVNRRGGPPVEQPNHSMQDEEPADTDQSPQDIDDPQMKRHPRTGGKGGTPDAGEPRSSG